MAIALPMRESGPLALPPGPSQEQDEVLPRYGTRGSEPGPRGCWAVKADGSPCGAAARRAEEYCNAHSGQGVAANPVEYSVLGRKAAAEKRTERAALRAVLGITRSSTPRGVLKAATFVAAERLAGRTIAAALSDDLSPKERIDSVLKLIDAVDPQATLEVSSPLPDSPEGLDNLSLSALLSIAEQHGITSPSSGS